MLRGTVVAIDSSMPVMQSAIEEATSKEVRGEHASDKRLELDVSVIHFFRDWPLQLNLVGFEVVVISNDQREQRLTHDVRFSGPRHQDLSSCSFEDS